MDFQTRQARLTEERRRLALAAWEHMRAMAAAAGFDLRLFGSLAKGDFMLHSDLDVMVMDRAGSPRRAIMESIAASAMRGTGIACDLHYRSDLPDAIAEEMLHAAA
ncbi:nucleotidyltransferase domain-containing protein [Defluviimonas salinarum]|uniref:Nucleotidyltransferase domain-containing protein n=1 Tax=Defluviimonas salinarum TaxID=2992147 RepID=A0ABT3J5E3_9RHOB|nr:nucleotidyltransferase domain-containing protein [Defluviimonas salinarum]MCW3782917.1 nucleotidyltransferase domain-containing protein [Defluviimonas salinarum]